METTSPTRSILAAVHTDIAEAKAFRIETIQEAFQSAKESPLALTTAAKQVTAEVRRLEKGRGHIPPGCEEAEERSKKLASEVAIRRCRQVSEERGGGARQREGQGKLDEGVAPETPSVEPETRSPSGLRTSVRRVASWAPKQTQTQAPREADGVKPKNKIIGVHSQAK